MIAPDVQLCPDRALSHIDAGQMEQNEELSVIRLPP